MKVKSLIDSEQENVIVQMESDNGVVEKKTISFASYVEYINNTVSGNEGLRIGGMPRGYYDSEIIDNSNFKAVLVIPKQKTELFYSDARFYIPYPTLVFRFVVQKGKVTGSEVFSVKGAASEESRLCHYPYTNVYDSGRICWGSNSLPKCHALADLDALTALFFSAKCNDDLFSPERLLKGCEVYQGNVRAFLQKMSEYEEFPDDILKETTDCLGQLL